MPLKRSPIEKLKWYFKKASKVLSNLANGKRTPKANTGPGIAYPKVEKETNDLIKKIKRNKDYFVSQKDLILLESLQSDGVKISKKYLNLFEFNQSDIPTDIQLLINNNEIGLVLLRFVEIIGEDELKYLGPDTVYFMVSVLNQLNIDPIRNNILLKVLPLKVWKL